MTKDEIMALMNKRIEDAKTQSKIFVGNDRSMEDWKVTIDDELLCDSKHYDTFEYCVSLMAYNAYDDKGKQIEGKSAKFIKKEYDNIK